MTATTITYNPFRAAAQAAFVELSSEQAQRFYAHKAQKDVQNVLDASVTLCAWVFQLAQIIYMMGIQCRAWCDALEANAQASVKPMLMLAPAHVEAEDPWEVEPDYEWVEFSAPTNVFVPGTLLMLPPASSMIYGSIWNPQPTEMHTEVQRMLEAMTVAEDEAIALSSPDTTAAPAVAEDMLVEALDVPGATGKPKRQRKASTSKVAAKPKGGGESHLIDNQKEDQIYAK